MISMVNKRRTAFSGIDMELHVGHQICWCNEYASYTDYEELVGIDKEIREGYTNGGFYIH